MGTASIYSYGSPVVDITGYKVKIVANYRDKTSNAPADHSAADASAGLSNAIGVINLEVEQKRPLSEIFGSLWNGAKDKNGKTMRDRATAQAVKEIGSSGGSNVQGSFPEKGTLLALVEADGGFILSYWLPNAQFTFNKEALGASWNLTFDTELFVYIPLQNWPNIPVPTGTVNLSDANISPGNFGASVDEAVGQIKTFFSTSNSGIDGGNLFAIDEGNIDSPDVAAIDLPALWTLLNTLATASYPVGFVKCGVFFGATPLDTTEGTPSPTLNIRLIHPVDPGPKLGTPSRDGLRLVGPSISPSLTQVQAGGKLVVTGRSFPAGQASALLVEWNETVSGTLEQSVVQWSAPGEAEKHHDIARKPFDNGNNFTITGLKAGTTYKVQVRDADLLTYTDPSNALSLKTDKSDDVKLTFGTGSASVALGSATRDSSGSFTANVTIPAGASSGNHTITASSGSASASAMIDVLGAGQPAKPKLYVVDTNTGGSMAVPVLMLQGATFELHGEGFEAGTVSLAVQGGQSLGDAKAGADGLFAQKVSPSVQSGGYTIVASEGSGTTGLQATLTFSVLAQPK